MWSTEAVRYLSEKEGNIFLTTGSKELVLATLSISYYDLGVTTGKMAAKILTGEADISTMPIEYTDATPKYNPTICEELGIQPLDGYEAIEG